MIRDHDLMFSLQQAITASAASTDIIDQGAAGDALDNEMFLVVKTGLTNWGGCTSLQITLQTDSADNFATAKVDLLTVPAIAVAALLKNTELVKVRLPQGTKRYLRLYYTIDGSNATTATLDAFLTPNVEKRS